MNQITLDSEKYFAQKQKVEMKLVNKYQSQQSIVAFCQFLVAVAVILLIVNYAHLFSTEIQFVHHWVLNLLK